MCCHCSQNNEVETSSPAVTSGADNDNPRSRTRTHQRPGTSGPSDLTTVTAVSHTLNTSTSEPSLPANASPATALTGRDPPNRTFRYASETFENIVHSAAGQTEVVGQGSARGTQTSLEDMNNAYAAALENDRGGVDSVPFFVGITCLLSSPLRFLLTCSLGGILLEQVVYIQHFCSQSLRCTEEQHGLAFVAAICDPERGQQHNHFLVPPGMAKSLPAEDLDFLRKKGCFSLPDPDVRQALLRTYFHHVHPFLPMVNSSQFIMEYENCDPKRVHFLLLWSMFLAAANVSIGAVTSLTYLINTTKFIDNSTLVQAGYNSRKAMKESIYRRAKVRPVLVSFWQRA